MSPSENTAGGANLTERQRKWFASVRANMQAQTGKSLEEWVAVAKAECAELKPRAQAAWLKEKHGIGINHASYILSEAFPSGKPGWDEPEALRAALWKDPASLAILEEVEMRAAAPMEGLVRSQRKGYTAWSRDVQFAAARPLKGGRALLGLKLDPATSPRLSPSLRKESWSERLTAVVELDDPSQVDAEIALLFAAAAKNG